MKRHVKLKIFHFLLNALDFSEDCMKPVISENKRNRKEKKKRFSGKQGKQGEGKK